MTSPSAYDEAAFTLRPVGAFLEGTVNDLEVLAELTRGAEHYVEQATIDGEPRWVLRSPRIEALWGTPGDLHQEAQLVTRLVNGIGRAERTSFRKVWIVGRYSGPGNTVAVVTAECATSSESVATLGGAPAPPPPGPKYFDAIDRNPVMQQVLELLDRDDDLSPASMWKVFELIRRDLTGLDDPRAAQSEFKRQGWFTDDELRDFSEVVNDQHRSGDDARHAAHRRTTGSATIGDARMLLRRLVRDWKDSL